MNENNSLVNLTNCKSCDFKLEVHLNFCPNCGGKVIRERLTLKSVFFQFFQNVFNVESKFVYTFKDLILKPEQVFKSFISGARKKYYHPISFLAIAIVLNTLAFNFISFDPMTLDQDFQEKSFELGYKSAGATDEDIQEKLKDEKTREKIEASRKKSLETSKKVADFIRNNPSLISYLSIPIYALVAFLVFWRKRVYNFAEMTTVVIYQNSLTTFLGILLVPLIFFSILNAGQIVLVSYSIIFLYSNYSFQRLFKLNALQLIFANVRFFLIITVLFLLIIILTVISMIAFKFIF